MTSHYRHRRSGNATSAAPNPLEPGEIYGNTANRQLSIGDAAAGSLGVPVALLAVRFFDARAVYAVGDFAVQGGNLYRANTAITTPAAFNASQWDVLSTDVALKTYVDTQDEAITSGYQSADTDLQAEIDGKVAKTGDTMTGPLLVPPPSAASHAASKQYVDDAVAAGGGGGGGGGTASAITNVPAGNIQATNVQNALNELDNEKVAKNGGSFTDTPTAPAPPANDNSTKMINSAWFAGQASAAVPAMDNAVGAPGSLVSFARGDHVHPTDNTRAPLVSPALSGTPTAPTAAVDTNTDQIATCAFVIAQPVSAIANGIVSYIKMAPSAIATAQDFWQNTVNKILTTDRVWQAAVAQVLTDAGTITPDFSKGVDFTLAMVGGAHTINNPINVKQGQKGLIYLGQPAAGNATITWGGAFKFANGIKPTLSTVGNSWDVISYNVLNSNFIACFFARGLS